MPVVMFVTIGVAVAVAVAVDVDVDVGVGVEVDVEEVTTRSQIVPDEFTSCHE